eukprot:scaffold149379_cov31-Attheya_sp.AAC.1
MLGTCMVCAFLELMFSVLPRKCLFKVFSPLMTSITVMLIGVALTGTGMKYWDWGGGVVCAEMGWKEHSTYGMDALKWSRTTNNTPLSRIEKDNHSTSCLPPFLYVLCACVWMRFHPIAQAVAAGVSPIPGPTCTNGEVNLGFGSAEFIGLGFS